MLRSSYSAHYRRMLPRLTAALEFRSNNTAYRLVIDALELLGRYANRSGKQRSYDPTEHVPLDGVVPREWREAVVDEQGRIERIPNELCVLKTLRDAPRREIYVVGAAGGATPEEDLPADFELNRDVHYTALRQPGTRQRSSPTSSAPPPGATRFNDALAIGTTGGVLPHGMDRPSRPGCRPDQDAPVHGGPSRRTRAHPHRRRRPRRLPQSSPTPATPPRQSRSIAASPSSTLSNSETPSSTVPRLKPRLLCGW